MHVEEDEDSDLEHEQEEHDDEYCVLQDMQEKLLEDDRLNEDDCEH